MPNRGRPPIGVGQQFAGPPPGFEQPFTPVLVRLISRRRSWLRVFDFAVMSYRGSETIVEPARAAQRWKPEPAK
jgi:hypothetical protein